ncbi:phosphoribosylformylglycinamidine synthase subunit PurQ [Yunchengibacter salinarum]|uniref:phosphoribosylformylglycinamidine synthase subunit PurQ n=1 Tax=Yunchengibacter salinarum TaxID=3133399 RepID=UPI0035B61D18
MKTAVITFPGSNCDRDMTTALTRVTGREPLAVWHGDADFDAVDLIALPGGFSFGDYLRCGAISARSPVMKEVVRRAGRGVPVLGVCNGFQILLEAGLLPGALMRNAGLGFICRRVPLTVTNATSLFTRAYEAGDSIDLPVAHHDGNYTADADTRARLHDEGRVAFTYGTDINGSDDRIAGILNAAGTVLGMMPHPERAVDPALAPDGRTDGVPLFESLVRSLSEKA